MSRSARLAFALLAAAAILPGSASAATSGTVSLRTDGQPIVARITGTEQINFQTLHVACVDREPAVTITGSKTGTDDIRPNLAALWVPPTLIGGKLQTGRAVVRPGTTTPLDLIRAFDYQTGGGGVMAQLPIGRAPGKGTTYVYAQTYVTIFGSVQVPAISNVIAIKTSLSNDLGGACPSGRTLYV